MVEACGVVRACSPRAPIFKGKVVARAVELYLSGVKPGLIRWTDLQNTLAKEFPEELAQGKDIPSEETVREWAKKYPDAPERLRNLRVQQKEPAGDILSSSSNIWSRRPYQALPAGSLSNTNSGTHVLFNQLAALMIFAWTVRFVRDCLQS